MSWIRDKLRAWLISGQETTPEPVLRCVVPARGSGTEQVDYLIQGATGIRLSGVPVGQGSNQGIRLISEDQAIDRVHFWRLWRQWNPDAVLAWEDGETFTP